MAFQAPIGTSLYDYVTNKELNALTAVTESGIIKENYGNKR